MIEALWQELKAEADQQRLSAGMIRRRIHPESRQDLFLALERPGDIRLLLLRIPADALPSRERLPAAEGFTLMPVALPDEGNYITLVLRLADQRYQDIFTILVEDVVAAVTPASDETRMLNILLSRLLAWQRFLTAQGADGLGNEAQQGLYGELWFLYHLLIGVVGELKAAQAWTGPSGAPHDFQLSHGAIEVKTTAAKQLQQIRISNERQLDETHLPGLWLFHLSLGVSKTGGESLPEMVSAVRQRIAADPLSLQVFELALLAAGYLDIHADRYLQNRYHIREQNIFQVHENFPRIIEHDLRSGVGDVHYAISVAECKHYAIGTDAFINRIREE